jgi:hypothetical protein
MAASVLGVIFAIFITMNPLNYTAGIVAIVVIGMMLYAYRRPPRRRHTKLLDEIKQIVYDNNQKLNKMPTKQEFIDRLDRIDAANASQADALSNVAEDIRRIKDSVTGQGLPEDVENEILARLDASANATEASANALKGLADENVADGEGDEEEPPVEEDPENSGNF